jgi:hypothetical protein
MEVYECISTWINWKSCSMGSEKAKAALSGVSQSYIIN